MFDGLGEWLKTKIDTYSDYLKFWVLVEHFEEALILRNGVYHRTLKRGLWPKFPIFEYFYTVSIKPETINIPPIAVTTSDGKTVIAGIMIEYEIVDSKLFVLENNDSISNAKDIVMGKLSDLLEDITLEEIGKKTTKNRLERSIRSKFEEMGMKILGIDFTHKYQTTAYNFLSGMDGNKLML